MKTEECDLLIVGGGPAGLSAAINGASEGLRVCLIDAAMSLGGQAKESSAIENYAGFPTAISGTDLIGRFVEQARKFCATLHCPSRAVRMVVDGDHKVVMADDYQSYAAKAVLLSLGLTYRVHGAKGLVPLQGRGVFYGMPGFPINKGNVVVVGGANSAGQAATWHARRPGVQVTMVIRRRITDQMSMYLVNRILRTPNITVVENAEVTAVSGKGRLREVSVTQEDKTHTLPADCMIIMIGATPQTVWLEGTLELDDKKFIRTGLNPERMFETSMPGVFTAGDVRCGSTKRIVNAAGEGGGALQNVHHYLASLN